MKSINSLFENAVIDCIATGRGPSITELVIVAERIWVDGASDRSAFRWGCLPPTHSEKLFALRAAQVALLGSEIYDRPFLRKTGGRSPTGAANTLG